MRLSAWCGAICATLIAVQVHAGPKVGDYRGLPADLAAAATTTYVAITKQVLKAWPNGAALGGWVEAKGFDHGKAFVFRGQFVDVWAKRHGRWQVIFTPIDEVPPR